MIRALRLKFVAVCMALVTAVLAVVLSAIYISLARNVESLSQQVLSRAIQSAGSGYHSLPDTGITLDGTPVMLPFFTVEIMGDTAFVTGGTYSDLENTDTLRSILNACLSQPEAEGTIEDYSLRYLRQDTGFFQRIAFVDMSIEQAMLRNMMRSYLGIALAALALLLAVAVILSYWVTRPVEKAWQQQRQFLSDASHELKTPLTVILSNAELLEASPLEERPSRWADNIHAEAGRMKHLVEEMLTLARADHPGPVTVMEPLSLTDVAMDCALSFEPVAFEAEKFLDYQLDETVIISGSKEHLRQLISILLDNAIKYGAPGGRITMTLQKTDRSALLSVSNPGEPIPPEQLPHLFERFYRCDASRGEHSGFGLGLSIAAAIVRDHKGAIKAESDETSTRFLCTFPLKK